MPRCNVCFHHCEIPEGKIGFCRARECRDGRIVPANYGRITSLALDPIEKKPLRRFHSGSMILSVGSYGCNLRCPFCQNYEISQTNIIPTEYITPSELVQTALDLKRRGNVGIAFTYNEPLISWEYVRDTAELARDQGLRIVMVTNGTAELSILKELLPLIDAMNIDLKGFTEAYYRKLCGNLDMVKSFIARAVTGCHVELTTLIVPGENDSEEEMRELSSWVANISPFIPLHISRFFPRYKMTDRRATDVGVVYRLADLARENLKYVYTGNC